MFNCKKLFKLEITPPCLIMLITTSQDSEIIIIILIMFVGNLGIMPEVVSGFIIPAGTKGCFAPISLLGRATWLLIHIRFLPVEA